MTIQLEAAQALAVVERARSLFGTPGPVATSGAPLQTAAESVSGAGQQMSGLSGQLVDRHASVVQQQNRELVTAGRTDSTLEARLANAAQITEGGARQMDTKSPTNLLLLRRIALLEVLEFTFKMIPPVVRYKGNNILAIDFNDV